MSAASLILAPSVLSADFAALGASVRAAERAMAEEGVAGLIHVDAMDGHFVPNLTIGPPVVKALKRVAALPLDVHLMIEEPDALLDAFIDAGADRVTVHVEACRHLQRSLAHIAARGALAGVALNPHTPLEAVRWALPYVGQVLVMTVNPGFGGQRFLSEMTDKIARLAALREELGLGFAIEVDGGISHETIGACAAAGATVFVAGQAVFGAPDLREAVSRLKGAWA